MQGKRWSLLTTGGRSRLILLRSGAQKAAAFGANRASLRVTFNQICDAGGVRHCTDENEKSHRRGKDALLADPRALSNRNNDTTSPRNFS
jgi:hypothetical protein